LKIYSEQIYREASTKLEMNWVWRIKVWHGKTKELD
jgi:hypothetical protein